MKNECEKQQCRRYKEYLHWEIDGLMATIDPQSARIADLEEQLVISQTVRKNIAKDWEKLKIKASQNAIDLQQLEEQLGECQAGREALERRVEFWAKREMDQTR